MCGVLAFETNKRKAFLCPLLLLLRNNKQTPELPPPEAKIVDDKLPIDVYTYASPQKIEKQENGTNDAVLIESQTHLGSFLSLANSSFQFCVEFVQNGQLSSTIQNFGPLARVTPPHPNISA